MKVPPACIWGILLFNAATELVRIRWFPDPLGNAPLRNRGCGNAARGLYGFIGALTRPVTYRSETVGVAEGVVRLSIEPALPPTDVLAIVIVYKLWPFIFVQYAAFFSGSAPQSSVILTNCDIISTSYEVNLSIIFVSDYNIFEIRWGNPSNEEEIF